MILHQNPNFSSIDPTPFHPFTNSPQSRNMPALASPSGFFLFSLFFILFFLANAISCNEASILPQVNGTEEEAPLVPLMEAGKFDAMMFNESRRKLGSFRICALCTCCGGARGLCLASPCCYAINCNIPNRPFGFCSFTPKTCNCFGCHL